LQLGPGDIVKITREKIFELSRSLVAGCAATLSDLAVLTLLVSVLHWSPRDANVPALLVGGVVNFFGNRNFAFRAQNDRGAPRKWRASLWSHVIGYTVVEVVALVLNGFSLRRIFARSARRCASFLVGSFGDQQRRLPVLELSALAPRLSSGASGCADVTLGSCNRSSSRVCSKAKAQSSRAVEAASAPASRNVSPSKARR
jgi:putative flippase GtrA